MANAKIISIVDHEIAAVMRLAAKDLEDVRAQIGHNLEAVRDLTIHAIADNTRALRHDINHLAAVIKQLRQDLTALEAELRQASVDELKQKGVLPGQ